ncbi:hypothetical protein ACFQVC_35425 [Streptomyces monticola]|uniref:Uncharacterized protein n=1 Tax=Streptomyces monticola TaxID=2666263 RepID=A0ABW2JTK5_9ACTN
MTRTTRTLVSAVMGATCLNALVLASASAASDGDLPWTKATSAMAQSGAADVVETGDGDLPWTR